MHIAFAVELLATSLTEVQMYERWLILAVLTFARTAIGFQFQSVAAVSPFLLYDFAISYATLGTLIGMYLFPGVVVSLPSGVLAQRFGDKPIACIGLVAMTAGGLLMAQADTPGLLIAGRLVSGTGAVLFNVLVAKIVTDWFQGREIVTALGVLITSWPLGMAAALLIVPSIANSLSWPAGMYAAAAFSGAAAIAVPLVYRRPDDLVAQTGPFQIDLTTRELGLAGIAGLVWTFYNVGFIVLLSFGPEFLIASGWDAEPANAIVSLTSWGIIVALPITAWVAERVGQPNATMIACFLTAALAIWLLPLSTSSITQFVLIGIFLAPPGGLVMSLPCESVRPQRRATAMGVYFTCYYGGMGLLLPVAGYTRDLTGRPAAPLWFAGFLLIMAIAALLIFRLVQSRTSHTSAHALAVKHSLSNGRIRY